MQILRLLVVAIVGVVLTTLSLHARDGAKNFLSSHEVPLPTTGQVVVCHGFGCAYRTVVGLNQGDIRKLREILKKGERSPRDEIRAIADAVAWFERRIGPHTSTSRRTARAGPDRAGLRSEADCIDESINTTVLLMLLSELKLLRHHEVDEPDSRGILVDIRYPHTSAVVTNFRDGSRWAIDPWTKRNGERPDTLPIEIWQKGS